MGAVTGTEVSPTTADEFGEVLLVLPTAAGAGLPLAPPPLPDADVWLFAAPLGAVEFVLLAGPLALLDLRMWAGMRTEARVGFDDSSCGQKLNSCGSSLPLGRCRFGSLSSSKKEWAHASRGE